MMDDDGSAATSSIKTYAFLHHLFLGPHCRDVSISMKYSANHFRRFISKIATRMAVSNMPAHISDRATSNMIRLSRILSRILSHICECAYFV